MRVEAAGCPQAVASRQLLLPPLLSTYSGLEAVIVAQSPALLGAAETAAVLRPFLPRQLAHSLGRSKEVICRSCDTKKSYSRARIPRESLKARASRNLRIDH